MSMDDVEWCAKRLNEVFSQKQDDVTSIIEYISSFDDPNDVVEYLEGISECNAEQLQSFATDLTQRKAQRSTRSPSSGKAKSRPKKPAAAAADVPGQAVAAKPAAASPTAARDAAQPVSASYEPPRTASKCVGFAARAPARGC
eukprot:TRINITY_DN4491_c0_g1_i2.p2 TRINITY_DN4491_c0_g1~~TRINITY_DN4491_c0_g1_i2.p2  ORF type:complete len:143 (-),score=11.89 TRINITY_DN4491_c0_g1_i2:92-520(-)